ncbi:MAG: FkbM family methyltransferase [Patescibacteria group bacterium]
MFGTRHTVIFRTGSDVATWLEVFFDEEYKLPNNFTPKTMIDLGANVGFSSLYFKLRNPSLQLVAVEPDPNNIKLLHLNLADTQNVQIIEGAVSSQEGNEKFYIASKQGMSSSFFVPRQKSETRNVTTYTFDSLLSFLNWQEVDLVKFDIEGAEWKVFEKASTRRVNILIGEYHEYITDQKTEEFIKLFPHHTGKIHRIADKRYIVVLIRK